MPHSIYSSLCSRQIVKMDGQFGKGKKAVTDSVATTGIRPNLLVYFFCNGNRRWYCLILKELNVMRPIEYQSNPFGRPGGRNNTQKRDIKRFERVQQVPPVSLYFSLVQRD
jgi:hypothetical protein